MTGWWTHGYPGGPMVPLPGFPRPLYPPDARGYRPSCDGPDVVAYKRTVSRGGRWPWQAFDDSYSNGFAFGRSGNVGETGVAGVQRQQHIDDTGYIGTKTFSTFRSMLVPDGLPHAGEHCMDAVAVDLLEEAWQLFGGHEPDPPGDTLRVSALELATEEIGVKEYPPGSNVCPYSQWYGMTGPWCAMFCTWAFETAGGSPSFIQGQRYAYVPYLVADARAARYGLTTTDDPIPGDLVAYDWDWNGEYDHIGLFERWTDSGGRFTAVEGNTSTSNDSNGGEVMRRTRDRSEQGTVFVRVAEP